MYLQLTLIKMATLETAIMISDKDSDSTSKCGSVDSAPQVSMDDSDGWEEEYRTYSDKTHAN